MPITSVEIDLDALTMTIVADFPVSVRRLWDAYVDPPKWRSSGAPSAGPPPSRVTMTTTFNSLEELESLIDQGMEDGTRSAMSQIDDVVADLASFAADRRTEGVVLSDTTVRVARVIRGSVNDVWRAHTEPELLRRWLLGPEGWTMPVCEVATYVGDTYRHVWERDGAPEERFGFEGELIEVAPPHRSVTVERMIGVPGPGVINELTLTEVEGGTLLSIVMTYPDAETRDAVLGTGMVDGMEVSYARLESEVLAAV